MGFPARSATDAPRKAGKPSYVSEFLKTSGTTIPPYKLIRSTAMYAGSRTLSRRNAAILAATLCQVHKNITTSLLANNILKDPTSQMTAQHLRQALSADPCFQNMTDIHIAGTRGPVRIFRATLQRRYRKRMQRRATSNIPEPNAYRSITFL